jgi:hypothetical protein
MFEFENPIKAGAEALGAPEAALALIVSLFLAIPFALLYVLAGSLIGEFVCLLFSSVIRR